MVPICCGGCSRRCRLRERGLVRVYSLCNISSVQTQVYTLSRLMRSLCVVVLPTARIALMHMSVPVLLSVSLPSHSLRLLRLKSN